MNKKVKKLTPKAEQARQKLKALTSRKTYYRLDTEFGVLTVDDAPVKRTTPSPNSTGKRRRCTMRQTQRQS
jgi:hypothetical protein